LMWSIVLLLMIMYVFSILFTDAVTSKVQDAMLLADDAIENVDADLLQSNVGSYEVFGSLFLSMSTLYQCISGGMDWSDAYSPLRDLGGVWGAFFMSYIAFCYFAVLNVMAGVFCQSAIESAARDPETIKQKVLAEHERVELHAFQVFKIIDNDADGRISLSEFMVGITHGEVQAMLEVLDLSAEDPAALFQLLGPSQTTDELSFSSFLKGVKRVRGQARALQSAKVMAQSESTQREIDQISHRLLYLEKGLNASKPIAGKGLDAKPIAAKNSSLPDLQPLRETKDRL